MEGEFRATSIDMKRYQLEMGNVRARLWRLNLGVTAMFLLAFAVACVAPTPTPTPTATPTPTPTPTATPTPTPTPALITVNPEEDPEAFLQAIPASERDCMEQAFGAERLLEVVRAEGEPSSEETAKLMGCVSEETMRRLMLGQMMMELDISEQGMTCISAELRDVSLPDFSRQGEQEGIGKQITEGVTFSYQLTRAALNCLSEEEAAELLGGKLLGGMEEGDGPNLEYLRCLYGSIDDETIAQLAETTAKIFTMGEAAREEDKPEMLDFFNRCSPIPGREEQGLPKYTPEQVDCVYEALGDQSWIMIFTGQRPPTLEEIEKMEACGM